MIILIQIQILCFKIRANLIEQYASRQLRILLIAQNCMAFHELGHELSNNKQSSSCKMHERKQEKKIISHERSINESKINSLSPNIELYHTTTIIIGTNHFLY